MSNRNKQWLAYAIVVVAILVAAALGVTYPVPPPPEGGIEAKASERISVLCATEGGNCVESWNGSDIVVYSDEASTQKFALDGATGDLDTEGNVDFDGDMLISGVQTVDFNEFGASSITTDTTTYLVEILDGVPIMTGGTNSLAGLNIDLGIGNSTGGTNSVYGILIDAISQDAQNTETGILVTNGWDRGIDLDGNSLYMDNDQDSYLSELADDSIGFTPGAATGSLEIRTGNLQVGDGTPDETHNGEDLYVEGISEFDGAAYFDGAVDFDASLTGADDLEHVFFPTVASTAFTYTASAGGTVQLFTVSDGEIWLIHDIYVNVTTNFDCTGDDCTVHIGDGGDEDGLCDLDDGELQTSDTEVTGAPSGWQCFASVDTIGAYITSGRGFIYAPSGADETIDAKLAATGDDFSAGAATVYVVYTRIQ